MLFEVFNFMEGQIRNSSHNDKISGFGVKRNWVKKNIFSNLSYWHTNLIRHNFDIMHIEKNFYDNIFYTVMDCPDRSKGNLIARLDIQLYCKKINLHLQHDTSGRFTNLKAFIISSRNNNKKCCHGWKNCLFLIVMLQISHGV